MWERIPEEIRLYLPNVQGQENLMGMSGAQVICFDDLVLKIQPDGPMPANEHRMLRYLQGKLPAPQLVAEALQDGWRYLLMSRVPGEYLCCEAVLDDQRLLASRMAEALQLLWAVDITDCPTRRTVDVRLAEIEEGLRTGRITRDTACHEDLYGPGGFASPEALYEYLCRNRPEEELVLSHGDFCLPNVFTDGKTLTGLIDLGYAGAADRWVDIEKGLWSMWANTTGVFGGKKRSFDRQLLFDALSMKPDEEKLRYFSLLDSME